MNKYKLILLFLLNSLWLTNYSQDLRFTHITTKDGLPNSLVFEIAQDKKGFIWFASNKGLVRYDGYNFRIFLPNNQRPQSISDKSVHKLLFDYDETLWISIQGRGLNKMDVETETFKYYFPDPNNPKSLSGNEVRQIYQHSDSTIWVATNKGLDYYDKANDCFVNILSQLKITANTVPNNYVNKIVFDNDNNIWILTKRGLGLYNKKRKIIESLGTISGKKWIDTLTINDIQLTKDNNKLWFATSHNGLFCYDIVSATVKNYLTNCGNISYLYLSSKGQLFVYVDKTSVALYVLPKSGFLTDSVKKFNLNKQLISITQLRFVEAKNGEIFIGGIMGLIKYDPEKGITYLESNNNVPSSIMSSNVEFIYIDNAQNLWVSLFRKGVDRANLQQKDFKWYVNDPQNNKSIAGNIISSIYEDSKKNIWVGCFENGVSIINKKNNSTHTIPIKPNDPSKINFNAPATMIEDKDGYIWIGYYDGQLDKVDPRSYKITHYHQNYPVGNPKRLDAWNLRKLLIDKFNNLWIASSMGIVELERKTNQFIYHSLLYEDNYMQNYLYRTMYIGNDGIIWAGSQNGGLIRYDTTAKKFNHFLYDPKDTNSISSNMVYAIVEENEKLWLGTSQGLNVFNKKTNLFERIAISDGMNDYSIYSILPDKLNNFWMSTDNGIIKFNKTSRNFVVFYESDGLPSNEYSTTAHCLSSTGEIYFGTYLGMVSFNPQELPVTQYKAHPKITDFKIFNRSIAPGDSFNNRTILTKQICSTKEIILSYKENDFILEFSALNYAAPEKIKYSYILEGYSDQWIHTTAQRRWAVFTGLPYGNYKFRLKATNNDGIECDENDQVVLSITITPPFWKALWFRVLLLIILAFIILMYFRWRINMVNIQKLQLEKSVRERTKELEEANVMLEENQEEINLQKEEILSQRDAMEEKNRLLTNQHKQITKQNQELDVHRNQLETLVIERTKELEKALYKAEESDRLKSSFLANMSHEIRTPMNAIIGFSNLLREKDIDDASKDNFISIIIKNGESLLVLINDILDLSKIQADQMSLNPLFINLLPILDEVHNNFILEATKKGINLQKGGIEIKDNFIIGTDKIRLIQVLSNLISNSLKFTKDGTIEFGVSSITRDITFYVSDTGIGIPENVGNAIFERFLKLEDNKEALFSGTGLGLAICKSFVELWGGKIWYESVPDVKTTFYFTHPISIETRVKEQPSNYKPTANFPNWSNMQILVAEDEENNFKVLNKFLSFTKANVLWAKDGVETVNIALQNRVDIVLMDIKLPRLDGMEATRQIKAAKPELPIIAQTAFAYDSEIRSFLDAGVDAYLIKPIKLKELLQLLKGYLGS